MIYEVSFTPKARKQLGKLPRDMQERIISTIERCRIRPYSHVTRIVGSPYYRLRVGDYRVIIDIKDNVLQIIVILMGHRKSVYEDV